MHHCKAVRLLSVLVCAVILFTLVPFSVFAEDESSPKSAITSAQLKKVAKDYNVPDEFLKAAAKKKTMTVAQFKEYAKEYQLPAQYVQRFVKDSFVFKEGNSLKYYPVKSGIPKNRYNWSNLKRSSKEYKYVVDGTVKAQKAIDVSEFQGVIDWNKVKADGVKIAFIRVGYRGYSTGKLMEDDRYEANIKGALKAGVKVGVYFYSQAISAAEARAEAKFVLDRIQDYNITYPVVFDFEGAPSANARTKNMTAQKSTAIINAFCKAVEDAGYHPMLYSYTKYFVEKTDLSKLTSYDKWVAQYYLEPFFPYEFKVWQYTSKGRVAGIQGNVDLNLVFSQA